MTCQPFSKTFLQILYKFSNIRKGAFFIPKIGKSYFVETGTSFEEWKEKVLKRSFKSGKIGITESGSEMNVEIDSFTPCLVDCKSGKVIPSTYALASKLELNQLKDWNFKWNDEELVDSDIYKLLIRGKDTIQGLVALIDYPKDSAVYVKLAESAPHNLGVDKKYTGV